MLVGYLSDINKLDSWMHSQNKTRSNVGDLLYMENPKDATRKLLELMNELGKVSGYKINMNKYLAFLYSNNKNQKEKLRKQSHLPSHRKQ